MLAIARHRRRVASFEPHDLDCGDPGIGAGIAGLLGERSNGRGETGEKAAAVHERVYCIEGGNAVSSRRGVSIISKCIAALC
jgi:hypothetical protein